MTSKNLERRRWKVGDHVRVTKSYSESRSVGMVFTVEEFSTHDYCEDWPRVRNPWFGESGLTPLYLSFPPEHLTEASVLDLLAAV